MSPFHAIIFDLDGVIVDSEPLHERAFLEEFAALGYADRHGLHFPDYYGRSDEAVWVDFLRRHGQVEPLPALIERKRSRFLKILAEQQPLFAGLPELVEQLAARYPLAVASGSPHAVIEGALSLRSLRRHFRATVSVADVGREKPAPDVFLRAAELLGVPPQQCCVIEDSAAGVQAALAARMKVIAITNSLPATRLQHATWTVRGYGEIADLLLSHPAKTQSEPVR